MALHAGYKIVDYHFEIWKAPLFFFSFLVIRWGRFCFPFWLSL